MPVTTKCTLKKAEVGGELADKLPFRLDFERNRDSLFVDTNTDHDNENKDVD